MTSPAAPIGMFDSGVGGFSILREIRTRLPAHSVYFIADQAHVPYGERQMEEIHIFSRGITRFLLEKGAKLIVVACNTASAAALRQLREEFPDTNFVGMEPAVKPASQNTKSGVVGVLATPATFQGELFASVVERFAKDVKVLSSTCPGLVNEIEHGHLKGEKTRRILQQAIQPMLAQGADTLVLGCTHYPFVLPLIKEVAGENVTVIDPAPAIARRAQSLLAEKKLLIENDKTDELTLATSGNAETMQHNLSIFLGEKSTVISLKWRSDKLFINNTNNILQGK